MRIRVNTILGLALLVAVLGATGCSLDKRANSPLAPDVTVDLDPSAALGSRDAADDDPEAFDPEDFVRGVDHPYFPLPPGTVWNYEKETEEGLETVKVEVLRQPKVILGVHPTSGQPSAGRARNDCSRM